MFSPMPRSVPFQKEPVCLVVGTIGGNELYLLFFTIFLIVQSSLTITFVSASLVLSFS